MKGSEVVVSALFGVGVSALCAIIWGLAAVLAGSASSRRFMFLHLGGMAIRLALATGLSVGILLRGGVREGIFVGSLVSSYALLMIVEILWLALHGRPSAYGSRLGKRMAER
ncbi:MAG: hypothetical protein O7F16_10600 [Acidobacteria bacterium]|nr:hypothetical protein [Acidobacteriota bacterium]